MPYIQRELQPQITRETPPKAVVIFGARQIGKTTLLTELSQYEKSVRWFNGDLITDHRQLQFSSSTDVELTLRQADTIIIDEAQRFPNIGLILKQLVDVNVRLNLGKKIFATGSSSLELAKGVKESAVGRLVHRQMWPLSISEIAAAKGWGEISQNIERLMIYGPIQPSSQIPTMLNRHCAITAMAFCTKTCLHLRGSARTRSSCTSSSYSPIT